MSKADQIEAARREDTRVLCERIARLEAALRHFAKFPLEDFGMERKKDDHPITGFNNWNLKVGHIRDARACFESETNCDGEKASTKGEFE